MGEKLYLGSCDMPSLENAHIAEWQPIETAPRDWSRVLLAGPEWVSGGAVGRYDEDIMGNLECVMAHVYHPEDETVARWRLEWGSGIREDARKELEPDRPTHWMPLPPNPYKTK